MTVMWHDEYYNADDDEHYADFVVVEELSTADQAALVAAVKLAAETDIADANTANKGADLDTAAEYTALVDAIADAAVTVAYAEDAGLTVGDGADYDVDTTDLTNAIAELAKVDAAIATYSGLTTGTLTDDVSDSADAKTQITALMDALDGADVTYTFAKMAPGAVTATAAIEANATTGTFTITYIDGSTSQFTLSQGDSTYKYDTAIAEGD